MIPWLLNLVRVPLPALTLLNWLVAIVFAICYSFCVLSLTVCDSYNKTWRSVIARWQKRKKRSKCKDPHVFKSMRPDSTKLWETSSQMLWVLTRPSHCGECFKIWVLSTFYSSSFSFSQVKFTPRGGVVTVGISCKMLEPSETYRSRAKVLGFEGILVGSSRYLISLNDNNLRPRLSIILWVYWEWKCRTLERDSQQRNKARCLENSYSSIGKSFKAEVEVPLWVRLWFIGECLPVLFSRCRVRWLWIGTMDFPAHCRHAQGIRFFLSLVSSSSCLLISLLGWASQGSMGVSSRGRGFGSTFYFELPLYASSGGNLVQPKPRRRNGTRTPRVSSNRVFSSPALSQNSSPQRPLDLPSIQYGFL